MIITCVNCDKKFDVESSLIPEKGRLLECNSCNHRWFFNNKILTEAVKPINNKNIVNSDIEPVKIDNPSINIESFEIKGSETIELLDNSNEPISKKHKNSTIDIIEDDKTQINKTKQNYNILSITLVFMISFVALIIIADTFKNPIGKIFPNIESLLYNLYESIKDIVLFLKDLI